MKLCTTVVIFLALVTPLQAIAQTPDSVEKGFQKINKTLGRGKQVGPWSFVLDTEWESSTDGSADRVVIVIKGSQTFSTPYRIANAIVFDNVASWTTKVYDLNDDGKRTLSRDETKHSATRYSCRLHGDKWYFDSRTLMHSKQEYAERPYHRGAIIWHDDGFELRGIGGLDKSFGVGGKLIPVVDYGFQRFTRDGEALVMNRKNQNYELLIGPKDEVLPLPDFTKPIGEPFEEERRSAAE